MKRNSITINGVEYEPSYDKNDKNDCLDCALFHHCEKHNNWVEGEAPCTLYVWRDFMPHTFIFKRVRKRDEKNGIVLDGVKYQLILRSPDVYCCSFCDLAVWCHRGNRCPGKFWGYVSYSCYFKCVGNTPWY